MKFAVTATARRANGTRVTVKTVIAAANVYAAGDAIRARLAERGAEYYPVLRFGKTTARLSAAGRAAVAGAGPEEV